MSLEDVLTADEVAKHLRIHPYTVRRLAREGKLPGFRIGGQWRFNRSQIGVLVNSKTKGRREH